MKNKRVLITGGTGFLGTQLAAVLGKDHDVTLAGRNDAQNQAASRSTGFPTVLMDVADLQSVRRATLAIRPDVIIHAAGSKSVEQAEKDPMDCLDVNVIGSQNVARAAMEFDCGLVVGVSSTRAAPPTHDTYGLSKATTERLFCSLSGKANTLFTSVRLGNIVWSTGSVLPVWQRMLDEGTEIISTGPDSRRFFLSVDEAVRLVILCIEKADEFEGKVFVPQLKQAQIKEILAQFIAKKGGSWKKGEPRIGERTEEILVGDLELPYCHQIKLNGVTNYLLCFNDKADKPLSEEVSTANAEQLSVDEIESLIMRQPNSSAARVSAQ
jgi:UDP-glucose 4-epimerase